MPLAAATPALNGTFDKLEPWRSGNQKESKLTLFKIVKDNNNPCLEISGDPAIRSNAWLTIGTGVQGVEPGKVYRVSFRYKPQITPDLKKKLFVRLEQADKSGKIIARNQQQVFFDKTDWTDVEFAIKSAKDAAWTYLYIQSDNLAATDKVRYDDIKIEETEAADRGMVINGSFEKGIFPWMSYQQAGGWKQLHKLSSDTPFGKKCLEITGDETNKSNRLIILTQDLKGLEIGTKYRLSLQFRSSVKEEKGPAKNAYIRVQQLGPKGEWILGNEVRFPLNSDLWTYRELTFIPDKRTATFAIYLGTGNFKETDKFYVDEITVTKAESPGKPFDPAKAAKHGKLTQIKNERGTAEITADNVLAKLTIDGKTVIPAAERSSVIFIHNNETEEILDGKGTPSKLYPFKADAEYVWEKGEFKEVITFTALKDAAGPFKIGVRHGLTPDKWHTQIFGLSPVRFIPADKSTVFTWGIDPNDLNLTQLDLYQGVIMPLQVMEGEDSYFSIASHSYDDSITFQPNTPKGYQAVMERNPLRVKKGEKFRIEVNFNYFDRSKFVLRDVWRDQVLRVYSNNPKLKKFLPVKDPGPRVTVPGPLGSVTGLFKYRVDRLYPHSAIWEGWHDEVHEDYPTSGSWWNGSNEFRYKYTAEGFRKHVETLQANNLHIIAYIRTFCNLDLAGKTFPAEWVRKTPGGGTQLYGGGYRKMLPKQVKADTGIGEVPWGMLDSFKEGCLDFMVKRFFKMIDFYKPWGIGWDCAGFDPADFLAVATVTDEIKKRGYDTKVVGNECSGPITAYIDWTIIENGFFGGKTPYDFEVTRALQLPIVTLERWQLAEEFINYHLFNKRTWCRPFGKTWSASYVDYMLKKDPSLRNNLKKLAHSLHLTWFYKDHSLGSSSFAPEEAEPLLKSFIKFTSEINAIIRMDKAFAIRFTNGRESDGPLTACAWADSKTNKFRLAGFNEAHETKTFKITLDKDAFGKMGWSVEDMKKHKAILADPDTEKEIEMKKSVVNGNLVLECELPAYGFLMIFADK
ncbi:MAG: hypothetical protein E7051_08080 [Lentisphaerae bacterium]|nr:hypothetical protein [Lentisphaerota bacterium]